MVDPRWHNDQVTLLHGNPDPLVVLVPEVKVSASTYDKADLLVSMDVLFEKYFQLVRGKKKIYDLLIRT